MKSFFSLVFLILTGSHITAQDLYKGQQCIVRSEFIFQHGDVSFPSCHASSIAETSHGLIAAWFGGTGESNPDVGIWISRFSENEWSGPEEVATGLRGGIRYPCWNPVLYNAGDEILLFYKVGPTPSTWWGELITSKDNGISWSASRKLPAGIIGPVKNKPVALRNGVLLCPSSIENDGWRVHMEMTRDNGSTWERSDTLNGKELELIQPTILMHGNGKIQILCRSRQSEIYTSLSDDNGKHWSVLQSSGLPNPNSGIDAVTLTDKRHFLVYNHLKEGRNILNAAISDDGINWQAALLLENDVRESEYSYPAVIQSKDNMIHITYTWNRKLIKHVVIDPARIELKPFKNLQWPGE